MVCLLWCEYPVHLLYGLNSTCTLGYVTYQDIRSISSLRDQTVIAVKAPAETTLEVPDVAGVRTFMTQASRVLVVQSLVLSHLDYCPVVWSGAAKKPLSKLQVVQNKAARLVRVQRIAADP